MSGDVGLQDEPILFYDEEMTISKLIVLKHKGVEFDMYNKVMGEENYDLKDQKRGDGQASHVGFGGSCSLSGDGTIMAVGAPDISRYTNNHYSKV